MPTILGYAVPILLAVGLLVAAKVRRDPWPVFDNPRVEGFVALLTFAVHALLVVHWNAGQPRPRLGHSVAVTDPVRALVGVVLVFLPFALALALRRQSLDTCLVTVSSLPRVLAVALGMALTGMATYLFAAAKIGLLPDRLAGLVTPTAAVILVAVAGEEVVYRGFLLTRLVAGFGTHRGIVLSGLLFGLVHLSRYSLVAPNALAAVAMAATAAAVSVGAGYAVWAARSSLYGVFLHWAMNMVQSA